MQIESSNDSEAVKDLNLTIISQWKTASRY